MMDAASTPSANGAITKTWLIHKATYSNPRPGQGIGEMMKLSKQLEKQIDEIPGEDGWWKGSRTAIQVATAMKKAGIEDEDIIDWISRVYWAAAEEFGN